MKLDKKNTVLIGFAFLSICAFWQMYDNLVPLMLTNTFHMNEVFSGAIMAADNVLALFLLPLFGALSDKCRSPLGRRRPFILFGSLAAIVLMMALPVLNDSYRAAPSAGKMVAFVVVLGALLVAMGTYRAPAVALMPDVTPKPLRSKANAVINLMGAVGGIIYLLLTTFLYTDKSADASYLPLFAIVAGIMLLALIVLMTLVNEPKLVARQRDYEKQHPEEDLAVETPAGEKLPAAVKKSLGFLLCSIALWFVAYNGVTTWFTTYAQNQWSMTLSQSSMCLTIATAGAIVSYIPVGQVASKIGRRKTIRFGTLLLSGSFAAAFVYTLFSHSFHPALYGLFAVVGIAWASINVNSLPMVVEMCSDGEVGKFTGLYYTFSMTAQIATPILAGALMRYLGYHLLFAYSAIFAFLSYITMNFVRHGDNKIVAKKGLEAFDVED